MRKKVFFAVVLLLSPVLLKLCGCSRQHPVSTIEEQAYSNDPAFIGAADTAIFEEPFREKLRDGWAWIREVPNDWRINNDALEIKMEPLPPDGARNILFRTPPPKNEGAFIVTVEVDTTQPFSNQFQQAGLYWMQGDKLIMKFVMERIDGELCVFPSKLPLETEHVVLRWRVDGSRVIAEFQPKAEGEFRTAFEAELPERDDETDKISLQCWHGPAESDVWARFLRFSISKSED
jgi:hypothetical protein